MDFSDTLRKLKNNDISLDEAEKRLRINNFEVLSNIAKVDIHRAKRTGIPEAIIADCKTCDEVVSIARVHLKNEGRVIVTRASDENYLALELMAKEIGPAVIVSKLGKAEDLQ